MVISAPQMESPRSQTLGTAMVALAAIGWGTWALFLRGHGPQPIWQSVLVLLVISAASLPQALRTTLRHPRRAWLLLALLGFFEAGNYLLYFAAIDRGPIAVGVLTHYLAPVVVSALAPLYLREPLGRRTPLALGCSLVGLALLVLSGGGLSGAALPAALLGAGSAFFYAGTTLVSKKLLAEFTTAQLLGFHSMVAALLLAAMAMVAREPLPALRAFLWSPLAGALVVGTGGGTLFYLGLSRIPAQRAAVLTYLEPLVAAMVGVVAFGETLALPGLAGAALILGGGAAIVLLPPDPRGS